MTSDTNVYRIRPPASVHFKVPVGHHVILKVNVEGMACQFNSRSKAVFPSLFISLYCRRCLA